MRRSSATGGSARLSPQPQRQLGVAFPFGTAVVNAPLRLLLPFIVRWRIMLTGSSEPRDGSRLPTARGRCRIRHLRAFDDPSKSFGERERV